MFESSINDSEDITVIPVETKINSKQIYYGGAIFGGPTPMPNPMMSGIVPGGLVPPGMPPPPGSVLPGVVPVPGAVPTPGMYPGGMPGVITDVP